MVELRLLALLRLLDHSVGPYEALHLTHQSSLPTLIQCHLGRLLQFADLRLRHLQRPQTFCNEFRQIRFSMHKKRVCDGEEQRGRRNLLLVTSWGCRPIIIRRGWCGGRRVVVGRVQHGLNVTVWTHPDRASIVVSKGKNLILTATINTLWSAKKQIFVSKNGRWKTFFILPVNLKPFCPHFGTIWGGVVNSSLGRNLTKDFAAVAVLVFWQ